MESVMLSTLIQVESHQSQTQLPHPPQRVKSRSYPAVPQQGDLMELRELTRSGLQSSGLNTPDLEMSRPATPTSRTDAAIDALPSFGFNNSASGALIPYMEVHYNIGYAIVSLIFVGVALGFILAAPLIARLQAALGRARLLALSQLLLICGYIPVVCTAPFPVIVVAFFLVGLGCALNLSISNVLCANLTNGAAALGVLHGSYGIGGIAAPLIATAMVTAGSLIWSRYYLISLSFATFNLLFATWAFWSFEKEDPVDLTRMTEDGAVAAFTQSQLAAMFAAFGSRVVVIGAIFTFAYQGAEVSVSGWVISFLINTRGGDPSRVGYVSSLRPSAPSYFTQLSSGSVLSWCSAGSGFLQLSRGQSEGSKTELVDCRYGDRICEIATVWCEHESE
ncbi:major facilitator superfamily domain-containing protein [Xylariales sp. PMI_506]|nr:major facilitator superfamily domain-containing protein [Xylariales sp. PMI_506]